VAQDGAARRLLGEPGFRLLGDVRGMIVEDQLDRRQEPCLGVKVNSNVRAG
jgi:hypothetical protein